MIFLFSIYFHFCLFTFKKIIFQKNRKIIFSFNFQQFFNKIFSFNFSNLPRRYYIYVTIAMNTPLYLLHYQVAYVHTKDDTYLKKKKFCFEQNLIKFNLFMEGIAWE